MGNMKIENMKTQHVVWGLIIMFLCGLLLIFDSLSLGEFFSRQYFEGGWSISEYANWKVISFMIVGALFSTISGFGLVVLTIKHISL